MLRVCIYGLSFRRGDIWASIESNFEVVIVANLVGQRSLTVASDVAPVLALLCPHSGGAGSHIAQQVGVMAAAQLAAPGSTLLLSYAHPFADSMADVTWTLTLLLTTGSTKWLSDGSRVLSSGDNGEVFTASSCVSEESRKGTGLNWMEDMWTKLLRHHDLRHRTKLLDEPSGTTLEGLTRESTRMGMYEQLFHVQRRELAETARCGQQTVEFEALEKKHTADKETILNMEKTIATMNAAKENQIRIFGNSLANEERLRHDFKQVSAAKDALRQKVATLEASLKTSRADASAKAAVVAALEKDVQRSAAAATIVSKMTLAECRRSRRAKEENETLSCANEQLKIAAIEARASGSNRVQTMQDELSRATTLNMELSGLNLELTTWKKENGKPSLTGSPTTAPNDAQLESQIANVYGTLRSLFDVARTSGHHQRSADSNHIQARTLERQLLHFSSGGTACFES